MANPSSFDLSDAPDIFGDTPSLEGIASEERGLALAEEPVEQEVVPFGGFDLSDAPDIFAVEEEPVVAKGDAFGGFDLSDAPDIFGDTQQDGAFQLDDDNPFSDSAPIISPIPGLTSEGGEVVGLPEVLADEPPSEFAGREGQLSRDEASVLWYQTAQEYNATRDAEERVKILGRFMRAWDPAEAEKLGLKKDGFVEPEGFWKFLDALDKPAKVVRTLINTMYDLRKEEAANIATDGETGEPDLESVANSLQRNWAEDKGTPDDGARAMRSAGLWLATMLEPETKGGARNVLTAEAGWEKGEDALADWLVEAGWDAASPLIKAFGDKTDEEIQESIRKSIEEGSAGGHFAIGLMSLMLIDPLNALSGFGGAAKGAGAAAKNLLQGGADLTPAGIEAANRYSKSLEGKARTLLLEDLQRNKDVADESIAGLADISSRINRVDETIASYENSLRASVVPKDGSREALRVASASHIEEVALPTLSELKTRLVDEFDAVVDELRIGGDVPASELRQAAESRAAVVAVADYNDAINLAWQKEAPLRGDFAVGELSKLRSFAKEVPTVDVGELERAWVLGLKEASRKEGVLVKVNVDDAGVVTNKIIKSPEVARIYRKALDGELGPAAKVAAERPEYDVLEKLLSKGKGGDKKFADMKAVAREEISDVANSGKGKVRRFSEDVLDPLVSTVRGGKEGREALSKYRASAARQSDLVRSVDPVAFKLVNALEGKFAWIDRFRRSLAGVTSFVRRPMAYAVKDDAGKWVPIPRDQLVHPGLHYKAQLTERRRLRARSLMMQKWPQIRAQIELITDDPEMLKLARHFVEKGWADIPDAVTAEKELIAAASLRKINEVMGAILDSADEIYSRGGRAKVLSKEETDKALESLRALRDKGKDTFLEGVDEGLVDEVMDLVVEYGEVSGELLGVREQRAAMRVGYEGESALKIKLASLKKRVGLFSAVVEAQASAILGTRTELAILRAEEEFAPELNRIHEVIAKLNSKLKAKKSDLPDTAPLVNEVDNLLRELEGIGLPSAPTEGVVSRPVGDLPFSDKKKAPITYSDGTFPLLNEDGTITAYYWTNKELAEAANKAGSFEEAAHSRSLTVSNRADGARPGYPRGGTDPDGGDVLVELRLNPKNVELVESFDGEVHLKVYRGKATTSGSDEALFAGDPWKVGQERSGLTPDEHLAAVRGALEAGKSVPIEVLVEYPAESFERLKNVLSGDVGKLQKAVAKYRRAVRKLDGLELEVEDLPLGARGTDEVLRKNKSVKAAKKELDEARKELQRLQGRKDLTRMERALKRVLRAGEKKDLAIPYGSPKRARLMAVRDLYRQRMASIVGQIEAEAAVIRKAADDQKKILSEGIFPKERLSKEKAQELTSLVRRIQTMVSGPEPIVASVPKKVVDDLLRELKDTDLRESVQRRRAKVRGIKDPDKRVLEEAAVEEEMADLLSKFEGVQAELLSKVEGVEEGMAAGIKVTPLEEAVRAGGQARAAQKGIPGQFLSKKELLKKMESLDDEFDALVQAMDDLGYDFRHPKDVRRGLDEATVDSVNKLQQVAAKYEESMRAFSNADTMRLADDMSNVDKARVARMINDETFHDLLKGRTVAVDGMKKELGVAQRKLEKLVDGGKGGERAAQKLRERITVINKRIEIFDDEESAEKVLQVSKLMKGFFDDWLKDMRAAGIVDDTFDSDDFFRRVDVAGYIPHMKSLATAEKVRALRGKGLLPSIKAPGFLSKRDIPGVVDDINVGQRNEIAEAVLYHQAASSKWEGAGSLADAKRAAEGVGLKQYVDDLHKADPVNNRKWDDMVNDARIEHGLDDMYDFFETDPMVLMERYSSTASRAIADATFIEDTLELFPRGRSFKNDLDADMAGYVRLDKVSHLESVIKSKLPASYRKFSGLIEQRLSKGLSSKEIVEELRGMGVEDISEGVVAGFRSHTVYVPKQIASYLNWMNSSDAAYANSVFGQNADAVHSWMKAQATIIALGHIGRNFIGNVVSSSQELGWAAVNPVNQVKALRIWGSWGDDALDAPVQIGKYTMTVKEWRSLFNKEGFFDVALSHDFTLETTGAVSMRQVPSTEVTAKTVGAVTATALAGAAAGSLAGLAPLGAFAGVSAGLLGARKWVGTKAVRGGSVMERFIGMTADEMKRSPKEAKVAKLNVASGAVAGGLIGSMFGLPGTLVGGAIGALTMPDYLKMMSGVNSSVEAQARLSMAVGALDKGMDMDSALIATNSALRDYSDLTPLEKNVLRRVFFFYTWEAGNMKFQLDWLRKRPRAANMTFSFLNGMFKGQFTEDEIASIPEHRRYQVLLRTGASRMIALSGLPQEPVLDILTRGKRNRPTGLMTRINPIPLTMMEWLMGGGHSVYYGKDWEQINNVRKLKTAPNGLKALVGYPEEGEETWVPVYKDGVVVGYKPDFRAKNPTLLYLMTKVPMWRVVQQYMILSTDTFNSFALDAGMPDQEATALERAGAFVLGWKPETIDFEQNRNYMAWKLEQYCLDYIQNRVRGSVRQIRRLNPQFSSPAIPMTPLDDGEDE